MGNCCSNDNMLDNEADLNIHDSIGKVTSLGV